VNLGSERAATDGAVIDVATRATQPSAL